MGNTVVSDYSRPEVRLAGICDYKRVSPATGRLADTQFGPGLACVDNIKRADLQGFMERTGIEPGDLRLAKPIKHAMGRSDAELRDYADEHLFYEIRGGEAR